METMGKPAMETMRTPGLILPSTSSTLAKSQVPLNMQRLKLALRCPMWGDWVVEWVHSRHFDM